MLLPCAEVSRTTGFGEVGAGLYAEERCINGFRSGGFSRGFSGDSLILVVGQGFLVLKMEANPAASEFSTFENLK